MLNMIYLRYWSTGLCCKSSVIVWWDCVVVWDSLSCKLLDQVLILFEVRKLFSFHFPHYGHNGLNDENFSCHHLICTGLGRNYLRTDRQTDTLYFSTMIIKAMQLVGLSPKANNLSCIWQPTKEQLQGQFSVIFWKLENTNL